MLNAPSFLEPLKPFPIQYNHWEAEAIVLDNSFKNVVINVNGDYEPITLSIDEFNQLWGTEISVRKVSNRPAKKLNLDARDSLELQRRMKYVNDFIRTHGNSIGGVKARQASIERTRQRLGDPVGMSPATLARCISAHFNEPSGVATLLTRGKRRARSSKFPIHTQDLALQVLDDHYLRPSPRPISTVYDIFLDECERHGIPELERPAHSTFQAWVRTLDDNIVAEAQFGKIHAQRLLRNAASAIVTRRILDRVEVDACHLAVGIVDRDGNFVGTVTVFAVFDCFSRSVLGLHAQIGRGELSASVIDSYRNAICLKGNIPYLKNRWTQHGLPAEIVSDGGSAYRSLQTLSFLATNNIENRVVSKGKGWKKPFVERFFGSLRSDFATALPGYCGRMNDQQKMDETVKDRAVLTFEEFKKALITWTVDVYHQRPHSGLGGKTPQAVWDEDASVNPPYLPTTFEAMMLPSGQSEVRKISGESGHIGITINNVRYNDREGRLKSLHGKLLSVGKEPRVECDYNPNDISSITVLDPFTDEAFEISSVVSIAPFTPLAIYRSENPSYQRSKTASGRMRADQIPELAVSRQPSPKRNKRKTGDVELNEHQLQHALRSVTGSQNPDEVTPREIKSDITITDVPTEGFDYE